MRLSRIWPLAIYGAVFGVVFYADVFHIAPPLPRSLCAAILAAAGVALAERAYGHTAGGWVRAVFGLAFSVVFFGDPFGLQNPFFRVAAATALGLAAAFLIDMLAHISARRLGLLAACGIALSAAGARAACTDPPPDPDAAWSAGFALGTQHACPEWQVNLEAAHAAHALPGLDPACFDTQFTPGSAAERAVHDGMAAAQSAAQSAAAGNAGFCADPAHGPQARPAVSGFLLRRASPRL